MKLAGVIAEYNPFHNGHAYHLAATRAHGATHIAVIMSGSFVQRGEPACACKFARARAAVACGADLVAELPVPYALASARRFAEAGVFLLSQLGVDLLSFGSEAPASLLCTAAQHAFAAENSPLLRRFLAEGMSYPRARAQAVSALFNPAEATVLSGPNNLLAVEYLRAAKIYLPQTELLAVPRLHVSHDSADTVGNIASASRLRMLWEAEGLPALRRYLPQPSWALLEEECAQERAPVRAAYLERLVLSALRDLTPAEFRCLPDVAEGLEHRLFRAAQEAGSLAEFYEDVKSKRFTLSRIRRIAWCAFLHVSRVEQLHPPAYLRILALNRRGAEILARAKRYASLPIGSNFADLYRLHPEGIRLDVHATDLHALGMPHPGPCGMDFREKLLMQEIPQDLPTPIFP